MRVLSCSLLCCASFFSVACTGPSKVQRPSVEETKSIYGAKEFGKGSPAVKPETMLGTSDPQNALDAMKPAENSVLQVVATVAGQDITVKDLLSSWMFRDSDQVRGLLDRLVMDGLVQAEASRLGLRLPEDLVSSELAEQWKQFEMEANKSAPELTPYQFIESRLGLDAERYRGRMEARRVLDLLAQRCVRAFTLENETVLAKMIVVASRAEADKVEAGMAMGHSFEDLAKEFSVDSSGLEGGRISPIVRSQAAISRLAFATAIGEVAGPLVENGRYIYLHVDAVAEAQAGPWSDLGSKVEASLKVTPIEDLEFLQWQAMVSARYEVDTSPLLQWVGEPAMASR